MPNPPPNLHAAICALRGESDLETVLPAIKDWRLAYVVAFAQDTHPMIRVLALLSAGIPDAIDSAILVHPALHNAVAMLIGKPEGWNALWTWAEIAPARWGQAHIVEIVHGVQQRMCSPIAAAALIGPNDTSAALLTDDEEIAFAIRYWGRLTPDAPTAWIDSLTAWNRDRLLNSVRRDPLSVTRCLPWLPPNTSKKARLDDKNLGVAIDAFVDASPTARTQHAALVQRLVAQARATHLGALTRLACAMESKEVWARVATLVQESPDAASSVVIAAPWNDLPTEVRDVVADRHPAIGAARGRCDGMTLHPSESSAAAFFAALDPKVWDTMNPAVQRRWLQALRQDAYLAVRSLGPRTEIMAHATIDNDLVRAIQRHIDDDAALHRTLLPVALRTLAPSAAHTLIAAMPTLPSEPGAFFIIASGHDDPFRVDPEDARTTLHTRANLARAVALQRCFDQRESLGFRCAALRDALHKQAWDDLAPILPLLDDNARAALSPHLDDMVECLARLDRQIEMRQALARLASLPLEVAIPTVVALNSWETIEAAAVLADTLHAHGDLFLTIADTLKDANLRNALLPLPDDTALANALRNLARDDPLSAHRLAHALHRQTWGNALHALLSAPPHHADTVWQALNDAVRNSVVASVAATPLGIDPIVARDPIAALALAAVQSDDAKLHNASVAALAIRPAFVRTIWGALPYEVQQRLCACPDFVDLKVTSKRPANRRIPRR